MWCYVRDQHDSIATHCHGQLSTDDAYDIAANPPRGERCDCCHAAYRKERAQACYAELAALELDVSAARGEAAVRCLVLPPDDHEQPLFCECNDRPHAGWCVAGAVQ